MDLHRFSAFDYMKLIVGSALVAAAFQFFTFPNSIVSGGVTGIAQIIHLLTRIPVGVLSILINIPIFYLGWRHRLGTRRLLLANVSTTTTFMPNSTIMVYMQLSYFLNRKAWRCASWYSSPCSLTCSR